MNRREVITGAAATALVVATPAVAGHVARIIDQPWQGPRKYSGPGWYLFKAEDASEPASWVSFVDIEEDAPHRFVTIRASEDGPVEWYMGEHVFDETCFAKWTPIDEIDRANGLGKYRRPA